MDADQCRLLKNNLSDRHFLKVRADVINESSDAQLIFGNIKGWYRKGLRINQFAAHIKYAKGQAFIGIMIDKFRR